MINRETVERILKAGIHAPSGDNTQPWSFRIDGDVIVIFAHPEKDHPILNVEGRGTLLATGALIENLVIAAKHEGLDASVRYFERTGETAHILLSHGLEKGHVLHHAIEKRHTHRGPYTKDLSSSHREALVPHAEPHCRIVVVTEQARMRDIANAAVLMEKAALSTKKLHYHFFKSILWKGHENEEGKSGLYLKTTELPTLVQMLFRLIRFWPIMRIFRFLGLPHMAAKANADVYASSGAMVAILLDRTEPSDFIAAGRCMQRVWLLATHAGLAAQPLAGLVYLAEYLTCSNDTDFEPTLKEEVLQARTKIHSVLGETDGTIAMMLRVGIPLAGASARTRRRPPVII